MLFKVVNFKFRNASKLHSARIPALDCICCKDTYPYRMYLQQAAASSASAASKQRGSCNKSDNSKYNKRYISMNSSCPYIKLFFHFPSPFSSSFCIDAGTKEHAYQSGKRVVWWRRRRSVFHFLFLGVAGAGLANCVWPRVRSGETSATFVAGTTCRRQGKRVTVSLTFINSANNDTSHRQ